MSDISDEGWDALGRFIGGVLLLEENAKLKAALEEMTGKRDWALARIDELGRMWGERQELLEAEIVKLKNQVNKLRWGEDPVSLEGVPEGELLQIAMAKLREKAAAIAGLTEKVKDLESDLERIRVIAEHGRDEEEYRWG